MSDTQGDGSPRQYRKIELNGYEVPTRGRLSEDEERVCARTIQAGNAALLRLVDFLAPSLQAAIQSADTSPLDYRTLLEVALAGARRAVERHALSRSSDGEFVGCAATMIQEAVAEYIDGSDRRRWDCGGDGKRWASARLTRKMFEDHAGASAAMDPVLLEALRARAEAIETLVEAHAPLLISMLAARQGRGHADPDLLQRGLLAMRRAAEAFDPDRHPRFSPLARAAIAHEFENARREDSGATASGCRLIAEYKRAEMRLADRLSLPPSERDVFESLSWSRTKRENYRKAVAAANPDPVEGRPNRRQAENPLQELIAQEEAKRFEAAWGRLSAQAQQILIARFMAEKRETRGELVARLGLSLHRVRRLEEESLETLRRLLGADGPNRPMT
jgi:RNA polymerase sigma factor (sigma-70 family)